MKKFAQLKLRLAAKVEKLRPHLTARNAGIASLALVILVGFYIVGIRSEPATESQQPAEQTDVETEPEQSEEAAEEQPAYTLAPYRGTVYGIKKPSNWQVTDNLNAIETSDPLDPLTGVSGTILLGAFGTQDPEGHLQNILASIGATNVVYEHRSAEERVKERWTGLTWVIKTMTITFTDAGGNRIQAKASAGVLQGSGQYVAMTSAFQTTPDKWNRWAPTLERIMQTIQIIDGSRAGGIDKVRLPTAADVKSDSSPLMEAWEYRNRSGDRTNQDYSDAILGQESGLVSPSTGKDYTLPLSHYDPTEGGYRNPDQPTEILTDTF